MKINHASTIITLMAGLLLITAAQAEDKIDRATETIMPRIKNTYGIGLAMLPKTSGSDEFRFMALPIINANYGDRYYINALTAGVWLFNSDDKRIRFGLAAQPRFGWDANDGRLTRGMRDRDYAIEIGPALRWQTDIGTFNVQWAADVTGASNGQTVELQFIRNLYRGSAFKLNGTVSAAWNDSKLNDYYFGVGANETSATRPAYTSGSSVEYRAGLIGTYLVGDNDSITMGAMVTRLGNEQAQSPIVETRMQPMVFLAYTIAY
jgi:MipA family protein